MHPSFSGLLVTWAYFLQITLPPCVTRPNLLTFTSMTVPLVITPRVVYNGDDGVFFTPSIGKKKVALKIWNASRICMSSLHSGHANLPCIVPIVV
ncbi:hypothetical protein LEMLEM_LOCUS17424 [Lemmus lemmus]